MGSCVSVHKDPKSAMKLRLVFASKNDKLVNPSPVKDDKPIDNGDIKFPDPHVNGDIKFPDPHVKPQVSAVLPVTSFSDHYGSKEEAFFDSQAWLESDCDDDFFSVKGDFTPSAGNTPAHGNTPGHRGFFASNSTKSPFVERPPASLPQACPSIKRRKLFELFKDSVRNQNATQQDAEDNLNGTPTDKDSKLENIQLPPRSGLVSPGASVSSGKKTPSGELKTEVKTPKSAQCCLPRLRSSSSLSERRKSMSPAHSIV